MVFLWGIWILWHDKELTMNVVRSEIQLVHMRIWSGLKRSGGAWRFMLILRTILIGIFGSLFDSFPYKEKYLGS